MDQLVGSHEIAQRLGLSHPQSVHLWRRRYPDFPEPVAKLTQGFVWDWRDVQRWARKTSRLD
ncbi:MAG: DNA-binding protein [Acidimicrobiia bacterium]|nr:DNA-binding protein [Acidimicrobiia bacterium]